MRKDKIQSTSHSVYTGSGNYQLSWDLNLRIRYFSHIQPQFVPLLTSQFHSPFRKAEV